MEKKTKPGPSRVKKRPIVPPKGAISTTSNDSLDDIGAELVDVEGDM